MCCILKFNVCKHVSFIGECFYVLQIKAECLLTYDFIGECFYVLQIKAECLYTCHCIAGECFMCCRLKMNVCKYVILLVNGFMCCR